MQTRFAATWLARCLFGVSEPCCETRRRCCKLGPHGPSVDAVGAGFSKVPRRTRPQRNAYRNSTATAYPLATPPRK